LHRQLHLVAIALVAPLFACSSSTTPDAGEPDAGRASLEDAGVDAGCGLPSWTDVMPAGASATMGYGLLTLSGTGKLEACVADSCAGAARVSLDGITGDFDAKLDVISLDATTLDGGAVDGGALPSVGLFLGSASSLDHVGGAMQNDTLAKTSTAIVTTAVAGGSSTNSGTVTDLQGHLEIVRAGDQVTVTVTSGGQPLTSFATMPGTVRLSIVLGQAVDDPSIVSKAVVARFTATGAVASDPFFCRTLAP
jgi:hypothetical protein